MQHDADFIYSSCLPAVMVVAAVLKDVLQTANALKMESESFIG
ncbi:hypothetical protein BOO71_0015226 [Deinococcus marmoris]|uniref:Uncharacterized protein n=1 Tax=Deinococcus marmoris TaxID=249408 RepID=A0A1U7NQY6_9DEIO|nr:hypothetical protein BOO71_0015226 [Deinococcus marmoris]